jgi:tetratricopeptide (TPR) repeat protein
VIRRSVYSISALLLPLQTIRAAVLGEHTPTKQPSSRIGAAEVGAVVEMTAALTAADERLGGGHARTAVVEYLATDVAAYLRGSYASEQTRKAMFGAAAQLAYLAGWKAHDLGLAGLAQKYYLHSYQLASESDPFGHAAYGLRILAHQAMDLGRREHCVELADAALALTKDRLDAGTRSLFWLTAARAHAANGSRRHAQAALTRAETLLGKVGADPPPTWASLGGSAEARLSHQAGKTLQALGEHATAEHQLRRAAAAWSPTTHPRVHALTLADLAETLCAQGKIEQACATWQSALDSMSGVRSARTTDSIRSMRRHLASYHGRNIAAVRALDARVRALESPAGGAWLAQ